MQKKIEKKFLVSEIMASEMAAVNCLYYEGNACHNKSMGSETVLRLCMSVREIFCYPIAFIDINKYAKLPSSRFQKWFFRLTMPVVKVSSETGFFYTFI